MDFSQFTIKEWRWGIPNPIWLNYSKFIEGMIKEWKLKPISGEYLLGETPFQTLAPMMLNTQPELKLKFRPIPFPGGWPYPHLHFNGEIFKLNEKQWADFSARIVKDLQTRLSKLNTIRFEQVMQITDAVER
jgi:hypothetical protein